MSIPKYGNLSSLTKYACRHRVDDFPPEPYRTEFERDRDRILYSRAFRRLKGKTQVFLSSAADHLRTRLTHTLEVSQISRSMARNLALNEILTEAIALGHDLGHTPFGHVGERTLNEIMSNCDMLGSFQEAMEDSDRGFKHNWQGLRVVCDLENSYGKPGLNLTNYTMWGILNHSNLAWKKCINMTEEIGDNNNCFLHRNPSSCRQKDPGKQDLGFYLRYKPDVLVQNQTEAWTFEGYLVAISDEIAQRHHDMEDALTMEIIDRAELISYLGDNFDDLIKKGPDKETHKALLRKLQDANSNQEFLPYLSKFLVNFYTTNLIETTRENFIQFKKGMSILKRKDFEQAYPEISLDDTKNIVAFPPGLSMKDKNLQAFLKNRILNSYKAQQMDGKGRYVIRQLFKAYITNPRQLYDQTVLAVFRNFSSNYEGIKNDKKSVGEHRDQIVSVNNKSNPRFQIALLRSICDNIAGMTDEFALQQHKNLYD